MSTTGSCTNCILAFEPFFKQYGVDLYLSGHSHVYQRNAPIYNGTIDPAGLNNPSSTLYIVNGAAGHYDGLDSFVTPTPAYSVYQQNTTYSWSTLNFHNCTHLTVSAIASVNNSVYDSATLYKNRTCAGLQSGAPFNISQTSLSFGA